MYRELDMQMNFNFNSYRKSWFKYKIDHAKSLPGFFKQSRSQQSYTEISMENALGYDAKFKTPMFA